MDNSVTITRKLDGRMVTIVAVYVEALDTWDLRATEAGREIDRRHSDDVFAEASDMLSCANI